MIFHNISLVLLILSFGLLASTVILLYRKINEVSPGGVSQVDEDTRLDLSEFEKRFEQKLEFAMSLINSQGNLISSLIANNGNNQIKSSPDIESLETENEKNESLPGKSSTQGERETGVTPHVRFEDIEKKLETLLNSADFTERVWQKFSRPFDTCAENLVRYLGENGLPMPRIEPYPALKDNNPNFWTYMMVQAQNWNAEGKRFLIPRNYDRYDPLWHEHLFNVRGSANKPDNYISGLARCAALKTGRLNGYIEKKLVETKGIIAVN